MTDASDERPLPPTQRRLERARAAGDIVASPELVAAGALAGTYVALWVTADEAWGGLLAFTRIALADAPSLSPSAQHVGVGLATAASVLAWPLALGFAGALLPALAQTGGWVREEARGPRRPFWDRGLGDLAADALKVVALGAVVVATVVAVLPTLTNLPRGSASGVAAATLVLVERLGLRLVLAALALGLLDWLWRSHRRRSRLRMTYEEARRERRESEGPPEVGAERRRLHHELQAQATIAEASRAGVLLLEPGRAVAAVAWEGRPGAGPPVLSLRGEGARARAIERAARKGRVPVAIEPGLVRALALVPEGELVPEALHGLLARAVVRARATSTAAATGSNGGELEPGGGLP